MISKQLFTQINDYEKSISNIHDKEKIATLFKNKFVLTKDRKVYYCKDFAIRFSQSKSPNFSNTILSLSHLQKYDDRPFFVCLVTPLMNYLFLANTSFLKKISHSSHELEIDNIKGSFNGSDIMKEICKLKNIPENFDKLFLDIHLNNTFEENLERLVAATRGICPSGEKFKISKMAMVNILNSPNRSQEFINSKYFDILHQDLDQRTNRYKDVILTASFIDNVKKRGQVIEYVIANDNDIKETLINCIKNNTELPTLKLRNGLGDYHRNFDNYDTEVDIKVKVLIYGSAPKGYNLDKFLEFLSQENTVFLFYFVGIDQENKNIKSKLVSVFDEKLLSTTGVRFHWAGRNSKGVTQFYGSKIEEIIFDKNKTKINVEYSKKRLKEFMDI